MHFNCTGSIKGKINYYLTRRCIASPGVVFNYIAEIFYIFIQTMNLFVN